MKKYYLVFTKGENSGFYGFYWFKEEAEKSIEYWKQQGVETVLNEGEVDLTPLSL